MTAFKFLITIFGILILLQLNCNSPTSPDDSRIYGAWNWANTTGGIAGVTFLPPPSIKIVFGNNGVLLIYRNDSLLAIKDFLLSYEKPGILTDTSCVINFVDKLIDTSINYSEFTKAKTDAYQINNDTLRIWDIYMDGFIYTYIRSK